METDARSPEPVASPQPNSPRRIVRIVWRDEPQSPVRTREDDVSAHPDPINAAFNGQEMKYREPFGDGRGERIPSKRLTPAGKPILLCSFPFKGSLKAAR